MMSIARSAASVAVAFLVAATITVGFVLGGPATAADPLQLSINGSQVPAPTANVTQTGSPPEDARALPQFEEVSSEVGFSYEPNVPAGLEEVNSGVYVVDFDGDGYEDVLAVGEKYPVLFRNTGGAFVKYRTFEQKQVQTAHFFDHDGDGRKDLLLAQYAGDLVFYENRRGKFVREDVGFDRQVSNPASVTTADFTGNGCLDVFVAQYGLWSRTTPLTLADAREVQAEHPDVRPRTENGEANLLYYGNCKAFTDATRQAGIRGEQWSLASSAADFTGDGYPDLHVGNDWSTDHLYVNQRNGTFERRPMGPASDRNAMSSTARDMDGDLDLDLFVTNIYYPDNSTRTERSPPLHREAALPDGNNYFVNDGSGNFTDEAPEHGLQKGGWGWAATVGDFNNDGHSDVVQTTESVYWVKPYSNVYSSLQVWKGTQDSWTKLDSTEHGLEQTNTYSVARIDYDNDGDLDLVVGTAPLGPNLRGKAQPFKIYENQQNGGKSLELFVRNPDGVERNAAVYVETDERTIHRSVNSRGDFQTQDSRLVHVGTGNERVENVTVLWPDGTKNVYTMLESGNRYVLTPTEVRRVP